MELNEEQPAFNFCNKVDLHTLDPYSDLSSLVAIAGEHGFRGISVLSCRLESLIKEINKPLYGNKDIIPVSLIDFPFGQSSMASRSYSVLDAKEKGAKEVEVVAPYGLFAEEEFGKIHEDLKNLTTAAAKANVKFRYIIDYKSPYLNDVIKTKILKILSIIKPNSVSSASGYFDGDVDNSDNILFLRNIKTKASCEIKTYLSNIDINDFAVYPKAGVDIVGLDWTEAVNIAHAYEDILQKEKS
jgi:deoxyribose-phosphate aldolase